MNLPPAPTGLQGRFYGNSGGATSRYYWVQAIYPSGRSLFAGPVLVTTPASLDSNNEVLVTWNPTPGAIGYDVVKTTTSSTPTTGSIGAAVGISENSYTDKTGSYASYTASYFSGGVSYAHAFYSFAVDGGAQGAITPATSDSIPSGAFLIGGAVGVGTAVTGTNATIAIGTTAGSAANSIKTATAITSFSAGATLALTCATTPVKMSAAGQINITVATADLTAGTFDIYVAYIIP